MNFNQLREHSSDSLGSGTDLQEIEKLESLWGISLPNEFRFFLLEIGYAEIFGDEIYSIYKIPDELPCLGLHWMNKENQYLEEGFIIFFSNDVDGEFFISNQDGKVYLNNTSDKFADSFSEFISILLNC